jgi:hypothetical protein
VKFVAISIGFQWAFPADLILMNVRSGGEEPSARGDNMLLAAVPLGTRRGAK